MDEDDAAEAATASDEARARLRQGLLAWGQPRPPAPVRLAASLRAELEAEVRALELQPMLAAQRGGRLRITKTRLDRLSCDGYQLDARPFEPTRANVRGTLTHKAIERDWDSSRALAVERVVDRAWQELASQRPGDPRSMSAWLNACPDDEAGDLRAEVALLLDGFREVWPPLPHVHVATEQRIRLPLLGGRLLLEGVPDLVLRSPRVDDRARTLVVDLKTGRPRSEHDRHELRFYALLATLEEGRPPFRWATFYVTEGRPEWEDLREEVLRVTLRRVIDGIHQAVRLASAEDEEDLRIVGGAWCRFCQREASCEVAAAARTAQGLSHPGGMLHP
jgi:putative RecB family exonuclease